MIMKMPKWLKILSVCVFCFTMAAFAASFWFSWQILQGQCATLDCTWYGDASNRLALTAAYIMLGIFIAYFLYTIVFRRAEWLQNVRAQPKRPAWSWVVYVACFASYLLLRNYSRQDEEFRSFSTILFGLFMLFFMVPIFYRQARRPGAGRWQWLCVALFLFFGIERIYSGWDSIGTSDLRHCLGQTYFQRVPVQSTGCEIIKAIPTPRYFTGRECPTSDLFAGCKSDYPYTFQSYNQRKAEGKLAPVPLPWRPTGEVQTHSVRCEQTAPGQQKCWTE